MATLVVIAGPSQGGLCVVGTARVVVGRHEACALRLADDRVSGKHLEVRYNEREQCYRVRDLNSTNGSYLQNARLEGEQRLNDNDEVSVGNSRLLFTLENFSEPALALAYAQQRTREDGSSLK